MNPALAAKCRGTHPVSEDRIWEFAPWLNKTLVEHGLLFWHAYWKYTVFVAFDLLYYKLYFYKSFTSHYNMWYWTSVKIYFPFNTYLKLQLYSIYIFTCNGVRPFPSLMLGLAPTSNNKSRISSNPVILAKWTAVCPPWFFASKLWYPDFKSSLTTVISPANRKAH